MATQSTSGITVLSQTYYPAKMIAKRNPTFDYGVGSVCAITLSNGMAKVDLGNGFLRLGKPTDVGLRRPFQSWSIPHTGDIIRVYSDKTYTKVIREYTVIKVTVEHMFTNILEVSTTGPDGPIVGRIWADDYYKD